jgi:high-affinity iron transporter
MTSVFVQSAAILIREGLEAMLVIAALAAYLGKAGAQHRLSVLYLGAGAAVIASVIAAWLFELFNNGVHNDMLEGVTILIAAALMLYVSGWLLLRQDPRAWQGFLQTKADAALAKQTSAAVALLAFVAVFREGAEAVLFVHALAQTSGGWSIGLLSGLILGAIVLVGLFMLINVVAQRLPLRPVFLVTSAFLFVMAVKFIGDSIAEFQEQLILSYTQIASVRWLSAIGLNATVEAISAQALVIVCAVASFFVVQWRARHASSGSQAPAR